MFFGTSHLDQRYLGDDPTGSAAQSQTSPDSTGAVAPGTLIPAPIITPQPGTGLTAFIQQHKPVLMIAVGFAVAFYLLKSGKVKI